MKKYLKILLVILIVAAIGAGIYFYFFTDRAQTIKEFIGSVFPPSQRTGEIPTPGEEVTDLEFRPVGVNPIFDYWVTSAGNMYYLDEDGRVIKNNNGAEEVVNSQSLPKLNSLSISFDGSLAVAKFNYPTLPTFSIFDTATNNWQPLPAGTLATAWSPNSQRIAYLDDRSLKILDLPNQRTEEIVRLTQKDLSLDWHNPSEIWLISDSGIRTKVFSVNLNQRTLTPILEEVGLMLSWSKDSQFGIKLDSTAGNPVTSLIDNNGSILAQFAFITLPSKCLIKENKIYCAIPKNIREAAKLPDDYFKRATYFDDALYLIDLSTTEVSELTIGDENIVFDAEHLETLNKRLYFKNRLDNMLYSLKIE